MKFLELILHLIFGNTLARAQVKAGVPKVIAPGASAPAESVPSTLLLKNGVFTWNKGDQSLLSPNFKADEFDCQCKNKDCVVQKVDLELIQRLEKIRKDCGRPLKVTSAFRCEKHQTEIRESGVSTVVAKKSQHELGKAVDVRPMGTAINIKTFETICAKYFKSIGIANTFLHLDLRDEIIRRWKY